MSIPLNPSLSGILKEIIAHKIIEINALYKTGTDVLFSSPNPKSEKSFKRSLTKNGPGFIFEVKRKSPSKGDLAPNIDISALTSLYDQSANAISVLTDSYYFGGDFNVLGQVSRASSKPILCKDFFIDPLQVYLARQAGADAILLMLSVLSDEGYRQLAGRAKDFNMDILTEVHDEIELKRAIKLGAEIIGINNRNLTNLSIDLNTTKTLAPKVPKECVVISESGIRTRKDITDLSPHVDGFLIGSSIMEAKSPKTKIKALMPEKIKICGLTSKKDAELAYKSGASFGGLIFTDKSPRKVTHKKAHEIIQSQPLSFVGVFMDESIKLVTSYATRLGLVAVQLHGSENDNYRKTLREKLPTDIEIWQTLKVSNELPKLPSFADRILYDTYHPALQGGTGKTFDWNVLDDQSSYILAGGLNPSNIQSAAKRDAYILDVNSGVENSPGIKCANKLAALFAALNPIQKTKQNAGGVQ